jgi:hypothetical protein
MAKRSKSVDIGFVSFVAAAALAGCNPQQAYHRDWQQCVDQNNVVVDDRYCDTPTYPRSGGGPGGYYYHWLYSSRPYYRGDTVLAGYAAPRPSMEVARSSSASASEIARGGFGSSAHAGGGGE